MRLPSASQLAHIEVRPEDLDSMTKAVLHDVEPIKLFIADMVSSMIGNARRTGLTDSTSQDAMLTNLNNYNS